MKKKMLLLVAIGSFTLMSCENDVISPNVESEVNLSSDIDQLIANYESSLDEMNDFVIKGYVDMSEKDEANPTQQEETTASSEIINYLKANISYEKAMESSKMTRDVPGFLHYKVGVFKTTSCGNYREFIYHMDCEDGGWTNIDNPHNESFATFVDKNKNIEFHMCVVDGAYLGGYALCLSPIEVNILVNNNIMIVERYHDNEDSDNKNNVISDLKPAPDGSIGGSKFGNNTLLSWIYDPIGKGATQPYGISYGVISDAGRVTINIDDENKSNSNWARYYDYSKNDNIGPFDMKNKEWFMGFNCWENTSYKVNIN